MPGTLPSRDGHFVPSVVTGPEGRVGPQPVLGFNSVLTERHALAAFHSHPADFQPGR